MSFPRLQVPLLSHLLSHQRDLTAPPHPPGTPPQPSVAPSYAVSIGYVLCDTADKTSKAHAAGKTSSEAAVAAGDTLVWQLLASVIVPGFMINRLCALSAIALRSNANATLKAWGPTAVGLAAIPFIVKPIDHAVDWAMDSTLRRYTGYHRDGEEDE